MTPDRTPMRVPMSSPDITNAELQAVVSVLATPALSMGPRVAEFERDFATFVGTRAAVAVSSGTAGLHLCVNAALADLAANHGWDEDDRSRPACFITTPFSFIASANVILYERAIPIFVDVELETGNIDAVKAAEAAHDLAKGNKRATRWLPRALRTRAGIRPLLAGVMPVHVFGQPCDMDPLLETARCHGLPCIEDACEAVGAEYKGRRVGTMGTAAAFAFYPNKQITTGEGGIVTTERDDWSSLIRSLRNQGRDACDAWLTHSRVGYNYRLDEMSAALGVVQLRRVQELLDKRQAVADRYSTRLSGNPLIRLPCPSRTTTRMSWFVYVVRLAKGVDRDEVIHRLEQRGIPSRSYFPPIHLQEPYVKRFGYRRGDFTNSETLGDSCIALPFSSCMSEPETDEVCNCFLDVLHETGPFHCPPQARLNQRNGYATDPSERR